MIITMAPAEDAAYTKSMRPMSNPDLALLAIPEDVRVLIYYNLFDDCEVSAVLEESSGKLILHPHKLRSLTRSYVPRRCIAITTTCKQIRNESLQILWSRLTRIITDRVPRSSLTIPNHHVRRVRVLELGFEGSRRSTELRLDKMKFLSVIIIDPYVGWAECSDATGSLDTSVAEHWYRFARNFIFRVSRSTSTCVVDQLLANTTSGNEDFESAVQSLSSTHKVLFRRRMTNRIPSLYNQLGQNIQRADTQHRPLTYDIGIRQCVDEVEYVDESCVARNVSPA